MGGAQNPGRGLAGDHAVDGAQRVEGADRVVGARADRDARVDGFAQREQFGGPPGSPRGDKRLLAVSGGGR
jgi:hypothetical protein